MPRPGTRAPTHELLGSGSLHASLISGGEEISMYPAHCQLQIERRTIPGESQNSVKAEITDILAEIAAADPDFKAQAKATFSRSPYSIDASHPLVGQLKRVAEANSGGEVKLIGSSWWMDSALFGDAGIPTVVLGPAGAGAHAIEEWVDLASVERCRQITRPNRRFCAKRYTLKQTDYIVPHK